MLAAVALWRRPWGPALGLAAWTFVLGNLYAMLFTRLEPVNPPGRPWKLLAVLVVWALLSSLAALRQVRRRSAAGRVEQETAEASIPNSRG